MFERLRYLDARERVLAGLVAVIVLLGAVLVVTVVSGDDDPDQVETAASSTTVSSTTTSSSSSTSSTTSTVLDTTTTAAQGRTGPTTTTTRRSGGSTGGTGGGGTGGATTTTPTTTATTQPQPSGSCTGATAGNESDRLATLFCDYRAQHGLAKMVRTSALNAVAQQWANKLAADHALSHREKDDLRDRTLAACSACAGWAENVAWIVPSNPDGLWANWLASSAHLGNIRDGHAGEYGMAVAKAADGSLWAVQNFGRYP